MISTRAASYRVPRITPAREELLAFACIGLLAGLLGWAVAEFDAFGTDLPSATLLTAGGLACLAVVASGPIPCLAAVAFLAVSGFLPDLGEAGGVDLTLADLFFVGLAGWWLAGTLTPQTSRAAAARRRIDFGQGFVIVFVAYAGLSLWKISVTDSAALSDSFVSWLRLVQTASLGWLAASVIRTSQDVRVVLGAATAGGLLAIVTAVANGGAPLTDRFEGTLTPNALGLVSGLVLLVGAFGGISSVGRRRVLLVVAGLLGLLLAKSVASFVATGFAVAIGASLIGVGPTTAPQRATRIVLITALAGVAVFGILQFLRPETSPGSADFTRSSAYQRIVVGAAGIEIFKRNPVIGVGWRGSNSPRVISDRAINNEVRRRFPDAAPSFYPDVNVTSVHNTYIQVLADLGIVGFSLLVAMIVAIGLRVRRLLRRLGAEHELRAPAWTMSLSLVMVLVWLNDNPLYGGQPETVLPALFVGALAATSRIVRPAGRRRGS